MSMLAEPRRKEKWTLNPRGKFWSEDKNKYGQKMLEKMGWSEGKGLGANEQGSTSHVSVKVKNDNKGLGTSIKDAEWCRHQEQFENLLADLNDSREGEVNSSSLTSLEEISKNSKKRLHYAKFTRGKDLTLYSKKDLDCILGVGAKKEERPKSDDTIEDVKDDVGTVDTMYGVTTVVGGNLDEYFKRKMSALSQSSNVDSLETENFTGKNKKRKADNEECNHDQCMNGVAENNVRRKKNKKSKKEVGDEQPVKDVDQSTKSNKLENTELDSVPLNHNEDLGILERSRKKKKVKKNVFEEAVVEEITVCEDSESIISEKKKKKSISISGEMIVKEKKRKNSSRSDAVNVHQNGTDSHSLSNERVQDCSPSNDGECLKNSMEEIQVDNEEHKNFDKFTKKPQNNLSDGSLESEKTGLKKKCKRKKKKRERFLEDIHSLDCKAKVEMVERSPSEAIKREILKREVLSTDKHSQSSDDITQEENGDSGRRKNDVRTELEGEVVVLKEKKKKDKKNRLVKADDDIDNKVDEQLGDTFHPKRKKSKKSKEKESLLSESNDFDVVLSKDGMKIKKKEGKLNQDSNSNDNGSVYSGAIVNTNPAVTGNQGSDAGPLPKKCKGAILSDAVKKDGQDIVVDYYDCMKKKEASGNPSEVIHVFSGANLKNIKGYDS